MKHWMGIVLAAGLCFCTACGSGGESSQTSQAEAQTAQTTAATAPAPESGARVTAVTTMSGNKKSGNRKKLTVPATEPVKAEITSVKLLIGADSLVLDLDEKKERLPAPGNYIWPAQTEALCQSRWNLPCGLRKKRNRQSVRFIIRRWGITGIIQRTVPERTIRMPHMTGTETAGA